MLVDVTLKDRTVVKVLPCEVEGLKRAGKLFDPEAEVKEKEEKAGLQTKEEKETGETKEEKEAGDTKEGKPKRRPVNISSRNIRGKRSKKT